MRYCDTYAYFKDILAHCKKLAELGFMSPIASFARDHLGTEVFEIMSDLRFPWQAPSEGFDAVPVSR
jgi:hypothetical protein